MIEEPEDIDCKLWRYMDLAKFMGMVTSNKLFLPRSDLFEDDYERTWSRGTIEKLSNNKPSSPELMSQRPGSFLDQKLTDQLELRMRSYISCWHMNEHESFGMWKLYTKSDQAIALVSSARQLQAALPEDSAMGKVKYIDYETEFIPVNDKAPFFHKRKAFEHEREIRALIQPDNINTLRYGVSIPIELENFVNEIYVSPMAPYWYTEMLRDVLTKYDINIAINQSSLDKPPVLKHA